MLPHVTVTDQSTPVEGPLPSGEPAINIPTSSPITSSSVDNDLPEPPTTPQTVISPTDIYPAPSIPALFNPVIQVFRADTLIPQLKTRLEPHQSLLVGKRSDSKRIFPDINLKGHFSDSQNEAFCSREQARVYINNHHAFILNLGKSPLESETHQTHIPQGIAYNWQLNEIIHLPGGLKLKLIDQC